MTFPTNTIYDKCPVYMIFYIINFIVSFKLTNIRHMLCEILSKIAHSSVHSFDGTDFANGIDGDTINTKYPQFISDKLGDGSRPIRLCKGDNLDISKLIPLNMDETIELWDEIMQKCLPNIIYSDVHGINLGTYSQFDLHIKYNTLSIVYYMFNKTLGNNKAYQTIDFYYQKLIFIFSSSTIGLQYLNSESLEKIFNEQTGKNSISSTYMNYETATCFTDLSAINWNEISKSGSITNKIINEINTSTATNKDKASKIRTYATSTGVSPDSKIQNIIRNFSGNMKDIDFFKNNYNINSPLGFFNANYGKNITDVSLNLKKIGARDPLNKNKYKFECMFNLNMFSIPHNLLNKLINLKKIFPAGVNKKTYLNINNLTNLNYLRDFDPEHIILTPGYKNTPITLRKQIKPNWALENGNKRIIPISYPVSYYTADYGYTNIHMKHYFLLYQGNMYEKDWSKQGVLNGIQSQINYNNSQNSKLISNIKRSPIANQFTSPSQKAIDNWVSYNDAPTNTLEINDLASNLIAHTENFISSSLKLIQENKSTVDTGMLKSKITQNSTGIAQRTPEIDSVPDQLEEKPTNPDDISGIDRPTQPDTIKTQRIIGKFSPTRSPRSLNNIDNNSPGSSPEQNDDVETEPGITPEPGIATERPVIPVPQSSETTPTEAADADAGAAAAADAGAGAAAGAEGVAAGVSAAEVGNAAFSIFMLYLMAVGVANKTRNMYDDLCEHADEYFALQLAAKSLAIDMTQLVMGGSGPNCLPDNAYDGNKLNAAKIAELKNKPVGLNCSECGQDNTTKPGCPADSPDYNACNNGPATNDDCKACQPGSVDDFNCVPDEFCIPLDPEGTTIAPCRCVIFKKLAVKRDALLKQQMIKNMATEKEITNIHDRNKKYNLVLMIIVILIFIALFTKFILAPKSN